MIEVSRDSKVDMVVKNGMVVTPAGISRVGIAIDKGKFVAITTEENLPEGMRIIDASGKYVMPGVIDPEGHPGHSEPLDLDADTETKAASAGGVTTWGILNPSPRMGQRPHKRDVDPEDVVSFMGVFPKAVEIMEKSSVVDFFFTFELETDEQALEIPQYVEKFGVTSHKFYLHCQRMGIDTYWGARRTGHAVGFDDGTVYLAMENIAKIKNHGLMCLHCDNWEIARIFEKRLIESGRKDLSAWTERTPNWLEAHHIRAYSYIAKVTKCPIYIMHITTPESIAELVRAKSEGITIYGQTGPHYLSLTKDDGWKVSVALRDRESIEALWAAVSNGTIDTLGSDHVVARGSREEMDGKGNVWEMKSGFPSRVETSLPVILSEGVNKGRISFPRLVQLFCENPARIFGLYPKKGAITVGADADLAIVDLNKNLKVTNSMMHTRPGWSVYTGREIKGWPVMTILRGEVVMEWKEREAKSKIIAKPMGEYLPRKPNYALYPLI